MKRLSILLLAIMCAGGIFGQQQKVAVYVTGATEEGVNDFVGAYLVDAIVNSTNYQAVERTADFLKELNKEQGYQRTGNVDDDQISRLGKQFGVQLVCVAKIGKMGDKQFVSARLIDVETATVKSSTKPVIFTMDDVDKSCAAVAISLISGEPVDVKKPAVNSENTATSATTGTTTKPTMVKPIKDSTTPTVLSNEQKGDVSTSPTIDDAAIKGLKNLIHTSCAKPEKYITDEQKFNSLKTSKKVGIERLILSQSKFALEPSSVNNNEISFFLRNRKDLRTMMVGYIPVKVDDALILFLDGEVVGFGVASMGYYITLPQNMNGIHTLSLQAVTFPIFNIQVDFSIKKYFLFDWDGNKKVKLIN